MIRIIMTRVEQSGSEHSDRVYKIVNIETENLDDVFVDIVKFQDFLKEGWRVQAALLP